MKVELNLTITWNEGMDYYQLGFSNKIRGFRQWDHSTNGKLDKGFTIPFFIYQRYTLPF